MNHRVVVAGLVLVITGIGGCGRSAPSSASPWPVIVVHKDANCGCCRAWVQHLQAQGFQVEVDNAYDLDAIRRRVGVPAEMSACHTAIIAGYFIEGHVPAADVKRLLTERPDAKGLTVPDMPVGSPGMEQGNRHDPYDVLLIDRAGMATVFAHHED